MDRNSAEKIKLELLQKMKDMSNTLGIHMVILSGKTSVLDASIVQS